MKPEEAQSLRELDLRYSGQGYELRTPLDGLYDTALNAQSLVDARARFDERHKQIHGHAASDRPVEIVSYRLRLRVAALKYQPVAGGAPANPRAVSTALKGTRKIWFDAREPVEASVYERDGLDIGVSINGPAIVEQFDATTIVPPGWTGRVDPMGNLILEKGR